MIPYNPDGKLILHFLCRQGMDHNAGLTDAEDIALYLKRDEFIAVRKKDKTLPYEIIRDEVVGRY